jgi:glycolate oxidase
VNEQRFLERVRDIVGDAWCRTSAYDRALYRRDASFLNADPLAVVLPGTVGEVRAVVRTCAEAGVPFAPRGAGTGLAGGAVPLPSDRRPISLSLARLDRILSLDPQAAVAEVEPGVVNADLSKAAAAHGLRFAPDPSSQIASTLGGNVATNAGGAHCLAYGVTSAHVLALELVDTGGDLHLLSSLAPETDGYDLRGLTVGSEGTFGLVTRAWLRLLPLPPETRTLLVGFPSVRAACEGVTDIIAAGAMPAACELMDATAIGMVEDYCQPGYPRDAAAVLLLEFEGLPGAVAEGVEAALAAARGRGAQSVSTAEDDQARALLWKGRKSFAGAIAQLVPEYYLHDVVVPRTKLADVMDEILRIVAEHGLTAINVFHAGDGNLHPTLLFDRREPGVFERVTAAGAAIVATAHAAGGVLSGEHGIGIEKRDFMCAVLSEDDLHVQRRLRAAIDPSGLANPGKVLPSPASCGDAPPSLVPEGAWV